jgi:hypothetical protein
MFPVIRPAVTAGKPTAHAGHPGDLWEAAAAAGGWQVRRIRSGQRLTSGPGDVAGGEGRDRDGE